MRLTAALLKRKMPNGNIWIGKHRLAFHVYPLNIERMVKRLKVEENNMLLLRHPYLTLEQEQGHAAKLQKHEEWMANKKIQYAVSRCKPSVRLEQYYMNLAKFEQWDV